MRQLQLGNSLSIEGSLLVREELGKLMEVNSFIVSGKTIEIAYDLLQVSLKELEIILEIAGARLGRNWARRMHGCLIHESVELEIEANETRSTHHYRP